MPTSIPPSPPPPSATSSSLSPASSVGASPTSPAACGEVELSGTKLAIFNAHKSGGGASLKSLEYARFSGKKVAEWKRELESHHSGQTLSNLTNTLKEFIAEAKDRSCKKICLFTEHGAVLLKRKGSGAHLYYNANVENSRVDLAIYSDVTEDLTAEILRCLYAQNTISNIVGSNLSISAKKGMENHLPAETDEFPPPPPPYMPPPPPYMPPAPPFDSARPRSHSGEEREIHLPEVPNSPPGDSDASIRPEDFMPPPPDACGDALAPSWTKVIPVAGTDPESESESEDVSETVQVMGFDLTMSTDSVGMSEVAENILPLPPRMPAEVQAAPTRQLSFPISQVTPVSSHPTTLPIGRHAAAANEPQIYVDVQLSDASPDSASSTTSLKSLLRSRSEVTQSESADLEFSSLLQGLKEKMLERFGQGQAKMILAAEKTDLLGLKETIDAEKDYLASYQGKMGRLIEAQVHLRDVIIDLMNEPDSEDNRHPLLVAQMAKIKSNSFIGMEDIREKIEELAAESQAEKDSKNFIVRNKDGFPAVERTVGNADGMEKNAQITRSRSQSPKREP